VPFVIDTSVAIPLRDNDLDIARKVGALNGALYFSVITLVELEGGVYRDPRETQARRDRVGMLCNAISVIPFDDADARTYGAIVASAGYARRKILDRMIAAQAIVRRATLVTLNPADFSDVPNLQLLAL
jgi:predicted nucleic acid-binding protein